LETGRGAREREFFFSFFSVSSLFRRLLSARLVTFIVAFASVSVVFFLLSFLLFILFYRLSLVLLHFFSFFFYIICIK